MTHHQALEKAYFLLSPFSDRQRWEFNNNLVHLRFITKYFSPHSRLLDAGCGIGILALALRLLGYTVEGIDKYVFTEHNTYYIEDQKKLQNIWASEGLKIINGDVLDKSLAEQYDGVLTVATIEHQKDPQKFLRHIITPLKQGGLVYLATPNVTHLLNRLRFIFGRPPLGNLQELFEAGENFNGHWREYSLFELKQFFAWLNLQIVLAKNVQSMKPSLKIKSPRDIYVHFFRALGNVLPGCGDTNIVIGKK